MNKAIIDMDSATQKNTAMVEEVAAAAESMSEQSNELIRLVSFFHYGKVSSGEALLINASVMRDRTNDVQRQEKPVHKKAVGSEEFTSDDWEEF